VTQTGWLKTHPYLEPIARLRAKVDEAADAIEIGSPQIPCWDEYAGEFQEGVPLLRSLSTFIDMEPAGSLIVALVERLDLESIDIRLEDELRGLRAQLRREPDAPRRVVEWLLGDDGLTPSSPGLLRCLGWITIVRYLRPVVNAFDGWRDEDRWLRRYCPTCGSLPAMAQLVGLDPGRRRFLFCGCCNTRWRYGRTTCPFCETASHRLAIVALEGEGGLRIDYCESCRAYLKTYDGQGSDDLFLSDWTSLHLDLVACDRGLRRLAASLYELEPALHS
jgi:FdhE protein